jgi:hypothetical protein
MKQILPPSVTELEIADDVLEKGYELGVFDERLGDSEDVFALCRKALSSTTGR